MKKDDHYLLGSLLKTIGIKGEILLKFNYDCPEEIQKLESIFIDVDNKLVPFFIEEIRLRSSSTAIVKLEGLNEDTKSIEFVGSEFYISFDQVKKLQIESEQNIDVIDYKVYDQNKLLIGKVIEFIDIPENPLLNVKTEKNELLIPAKDELIIEIDDDLMEIHVNIPEGLFDID
ncbi:ribosome maturation factor RimM [Bacteroidota bacterium]